MSHAFANRVSVRLFIQAALTGLLALPSAHGSTWMLVTFAVAVAAAAVGAAIRSNPANARQAVVGFEVAAVAIGMVGLLGGHYIPGTIVGVATLITVLGTHEVAVATPAPSVAEMAPVAAPEPVVPVPGPAVAVPGPAPAPLFATAATPAPPPPAVTEFAPAPRAMTILPGQ